MHKASYSVILSVENKITLVFFSCDIHDFNKLRLNTELLPIFEKPCLLNNKSWLNQRKTIWHTEQSKPDYMWHGYFPPVKYPWA